MTSKAITVRDFRKEIPGKFADETTWEFPPITTITSRKQVSVWQIKVRLFVLDDTIILPDVPDDRFIAIEDEHYAEHGRNLDPMLRGWHKVFNGMNGNINKTDATIISTGLNIGKSNETNVWTQALRDAYGIYNKKAKKSTATPTATLIENTAVATCELAMFPPLLAQVYVPGKLDPELKVFVQRKYDGLRAVSMMACDDKQYRPVMYSRGLNEYAGLDYIKEEVARTLADAWQSGRKIYLDGEIYKHGVPLQQISGDARRGNAETKYNYVVYDCFDLADMKMLYADRLELLQSIIADTTYIIIAPTECVAVKDVMPIFEEFVAESYEGAMIRLNAPYEFCYNNSHKDQLLKIKKTHDAELEICGWGTAKKGKAAGALMIICRTENGKQFPVTPAMETSERKAMANVFNIRGDDGKTTYERDWEGQKIIVQYDDISTDGVPLRARTRMEKRTWD